MQPNCSAGTASGSGLTSTNAAARDAWFRGDFEVCLEILDGLGAAGDGQGDDEGGLRETLLLRARALLRLRRPAEVVALLGDVLSTFRGIDEGCTARMLHGEAVARVGDPDRGLALLTEVYAAGQALGAHRAIRGEIAYKIAFTHWLKRDYRATLEFAVVAEASQADIISARAAFLRGFVAAAQERYKEALALFHSALEKYRSCRERDQDLMELIVFQISAFELNLRSADVRGTHAVQLSGTRIVALDRPGVSPMGIASRDAWLFALDGDRERAFEKARVAQRLAPTPCWQVWALANRAQLKSEFGDPDGAREFGADALEIAERIDWEQFDGDERLALLVLAEALAVTNKPAAVQVLRRYDALRTDVDRALAHQNDIRVWILETFVRGLVLRIEGEHGQAYDAFEAVYRACERVGMRWRAALALIELDATPLGRRGDFHLELAARIIHEHFPQAYLARRLGRWNNVYRDPVAAKLAPSERKVLRQLLDGKSQKEVAAALGLTPDTVGFYVKVLLRKFDVRSTLELAVLCYKRGLGSPSWWLAEEDRHAVYAEKSLPGRASKKSA